MKKTAQELLAGLRYWNKLVPIGSVWMHYKGGTYEITGIVVDTGPLNGYNILYRRVAGPDFNGPDEAGIVFSREADEWGQVVNHINGHRRFEKIRD